MLKPVIKLILIVSLFFYFGTDSKVMAQSTKIVNIAASCSRTARESSPLFAVDGDFTTSWNSGGSPPQWILLELPRSVTINKINLVPNQSPSGRTIHKIEVGTNLSQLQLVTTLDQITYNNKPISLTFLEPKSEIKYVKVTTIQSPSWVGWREIEVFEGNVPTASHLKYFGYYSLNMWKSDDPNPLIGPAFEEAMAMENINFVEIPMGDRYSEVIFQTKRNILEEYKKRNLSVIVKPGWLFFSSYGSYRNGTSARLRPDWLDRWKSFSSLFHAYENNIYGFYFDEPVWRGVSTQDFITISSQIRQDFPNQALMIVEAEPVIKEEAVPEGFLTFVTDIGFDYYFTRHTSDNEIGWTNYLNVFEKFLKLAGNRNIWLIPDGAGEAGRVFDAFERYLSLALTNQQVVGFYSFLYYHDQFPDSLRSMLSPNGNQYSLQFRSRHIQVGKSIINNNQQNVQIGDANGDGRVDGLDYLIWLNHYGQSVAGNTNGDFNNDGTVDGTDIEIWSTHYII